MSATVAEIRAAIAAALSGITSLRVTDRWPATLNPPAAIVRRVRTEYGTEFNGGHTSAFAISLYLPAVDTLNAQTALDGYLSPTGAASVIAAITNDTALGGVVRSLTVSTVDEEGLIEMGGVNYLGATIPLTVVHD